MRRVSTHFGFHSEYQSGVVAEHAVDPESAERVWHESVRLLA